MTKYYCHFLTLNTSVIVPVTSECHHTGQRGGVCVTSRLSEKMLGSVRSDIFRQATVHSSCFSTLQQENVKPFFCR
jgi:hypothetical protein